MKSIYKPFILAFLITGSFNSCKKEVEVLNPGPSQIEYMEYSINSDGNNNLKPNPGEKFSLRVKVKNTGDYHLKNVKAKLTSGNPDVVVESAENVNFYSSESNYNNPNIYKGTYGYGDFNLLLSANLKGGEEFPVYLELEDEAKFVYRDTFSVLVFDSGAMCKFKLFTLSNEFNDDREVNPGEYLYFTPSVMNVGSENLQNLTLSINANSQYIKNLNFNDPQFLREGSNPYSYNQVRSGFLAFGYYNNSLEIQSNTPVGTVIPFNIIINDGNGRTWNDTIKIKVVSSETDIQFKDFEVYSDDNNNKKINPGETAYLKVNLLNAGKNKAPGVKVSFSSTDVRINSLKPTDYVRFNKNGQNYSNQYDYIFSNDLGRSNVSDYLSFKVDQATLPGTKIKINMSIKDKFNQIKNESFEFTVE